MNTRTDLDWIWALCVFALVAVGCLAEPVELPGDLVTEELAELYSSEDVVEMTGEQYVQVVWAEDCRAKLSPDEALRPYVERAVDWWSEAVPCELWIGEGGTPVTLGDAGTNENGIRRNAQAVLGFDDDELRHGLGYWYIARVIVSDAISLDDVNTSVLHEIGHLIGADHTETGLMSRKSQGATHAIDQAAIDAVCEAVHCD